MTNPSSLGAATAMTSCSMPPAVYRALRALNATHAVTLVDLPAEHDSSMVRHDPVFVDRKHVGSLAWTDEQWRLRCAGVRTSYNPEHDLNHETLTLRPTDPRWLDFVFWSLNNKVNEHQFEAIGGTGWRGPTGGVLFHWAPGSHWERDSLHSFGFVIGHIIGEHRWTDTMFPGLLRAVWRRLRCERKGSPG